MTKLWIITLLYPTVKSMSFENNLTPTAAPTKGLPRC